MVINHISQRDLFQFNGSALFSLIRKVDPLIYCCYVLGTVIHNDDCHEWVWNLLVCSYYKIDEHGMFPWTCRGMVVFLLASIPNFSFSIDSLLSVIFHKTYIAPPSARCIFQ